MDAALTLIALSFGLAMLAYAALGARLLHLGYATKHREPLRKLVLAAVWLTAIWAAFFLAGQWLRQGWLLVASDLFDILRYAVWMAFLIGLLKQQRDGKLPHGFAWLPAFTGMLLLYCLVTRFLVYTRSDWLGDPRSAALYGAVAMSVFMLVLVEQLFANVSEDSRWNVKPLCLGLVGFALFDLYMYTQALLLTRPDEDARNMRGAVHALMSTLLWLAATRRANWLEKIQLSRQAAFHSATLLLVGTYLLFVSGIGYYVRFFGGDWGRALQLGVFTVAILFLVVLAVSGSARARLRVFLGKHFFRYRYDYREEWLRFTRTLSMQTSPQQMGQQIVRGLADLLESPGGALWVRSRDGQTFTQTAHWNFNESTVPEPSDSALCSFLLTSGWVVNIEEFRAYPRRYGNLTLPPWLQNAAQAWLVVPLVVTDGLIGFVVLASARTRVEVNWEVNDLLKTAGRQAASFLAQMQATEALLEVRKFESFNRMSAFVVHDLKNIVTQLSLMMKNAKRHAGNPEFQKDMLHTVENSLDRMRQMMLQLREGASPPGGSVGVDLGEVIQHLADAAIGRGRQLGLDLEPHVGTRGQQDRLERVLGHVVQNAFDATPSHGTVKVTLNREGSQACVKVIDSGQGMTQEFIRERLFKPFQTTKQSGMGIGAYESFQYVQELGGKINVESQVGQGTEVTIWLPLFEIHSESDLHPLPSQ
jgi:putative PEP-CTERM system histidine kinase